MDSFTNWYNHEHRHTVIGLHTPTDVHFGSRQTKPRTAEVSSPRPASSTHTVSAPQPRRDSGPTESIWINRTADKPEDAQDSNAAA